jgi:hypothetical protein
MSMSKELTDLTVGTLRKVTLRVHTDRVGYPTSNRRRHPANNISNNSNHYEAIRPSVS